MKKKNIVFAVVTCFSLCLASDWPTFRGDMQRTGCSPQKTGLPSARPLWQYRAKGAFVSSPSIVKDALYIGCRDSTLCAIGATTGSRLWSRKMKGWFDSSPVLYGDSLVVGCLDQHIYVLNRNTGVSLGEFPAGFQLSSPAVLADGTILTLIGHPYNALAKYQRDGPKNPWPLLFKQPMYSSVAVAGNMAVFGGNDGFLYGVNLSSNRIQWSVRTAGTTYLSTPAISDSLVFFAPGDFDRNIYAVWLSDGAIYWKGEGNGNRAKTGPAAVARVPSSLIGRMQHMTPLQRTRWLEYYQKQGAPFAKRSLLEKSSAGSAAGWVSADDRVRTSSVTVDANNVYLVQRELGYTNIIDMVPQSRYTLLAIDKATGNQVWSFTDYCTGAIAGYNASPVATVSHLFFGWGEGMVYACDKKSGQVVWRDTLNGDILSSPAVANGKLYVATMAGNLYCFDLKNTPTGLDFQQSTFCYPNPARGRASTIQVYVERAGKLSMTLFNIAERPVFHVDENLQAGQKYVKEWDLSGVANGVYFAQIKVIYTQGGVDKKTLKIAVLH